jgi:predicted nucleic acid-binding protein
MRLPIELHDETGLHQRAVEIAARFNLPAAYDAHYLALAERLGAGFYTGDARLARAVGGELPWVRLIQ